MRERTTTDLDTALVSCVPDVRLGDFSITPTHAIPVLAYSTLQRFPDVLRGVWRVSCRRFKPNGAELHQAVYQVCDLTSISTHSTYYKTTLNEVNHTQK